MTLCAWKVLTNLPATPSRIFVRYRLHLSGKPIGVAKTLKQRLEERNTQDPTLTFKVDIGFPHLRVKRRKLVEERLSHLKEQQYDAKLEKLARTGELKVPLEAVRAEWWKTDGPIQVKQIAEHFGVFKHLFGDAYFTPCQELKVAFKQTDGVSIPVCFGNIIKPSEAATAPEVTFDSDPSSLWTLVLTNPDGHFTTPDAEYVHWLIGNIPGNDISKGNKVFEYMQPFPPQGTGYHRLVFILYKQSQKLDYSPLTKPDPCLSLKNRTFSTYEFYRERQDHMTPAGLAFFQSDWDNSLTDFFHHTLNMREPTYEYDFAPPYVRPQEWFPKKKAFNLYLDRYRDPKKIAEEYILQKLKKVHPFKRPEPPMPFPNAIPYPKNAPSWLRTKMMADRLKWGRINDH